MASPVFVRGEHSNLFIPYDRHDPAARAMIRRCTEDRKGEALGPQSVGGLWSMVVGTTLGMEMKTPGSFVRSGASFEDFASLLSKILNEPDNPHEACAGRAVTRDALDSLAQNPGGHFATLQKLSPYATEHALERVSDAAGRLVRADISVGYTPAADATPLVRDPSDPTKPADHAGTQLFAMYKDIILNTPRAWDEGTPAYGLNKLASHETLGAITEAATFLGDLLTSDVQAGFDAYEATVVDMLPRPLGTPLNITRIGYEDANTPYQFA